MRIIIITGQTASGKTEIAERIRDEINGEIISADSRAFYRQIPIGSGRYSISGDVPYHLIDMLDIGERLPVHDFLIRSRSIIDGIIDRGRVPIICGGTMLFIERLIKGMDPTPDPDQWFRDCMMNISRYHGTDYLHHLLMERDPDLAGKVHENNLNIIIRYLERAYLPEERLRSRIPPLENYQCFFITRNIDSIRSRIERRTDHMLLLGLVEEGKALLESGKDLSESGLDSIGYDRIASYLAGEMNHRSMRDHIVSDTMKLARSQLKWIGRFPNREMKLDMMTWDDSVSEIISSVYGE